MVDTILNIKVHINNASSLYICNNGELLIDEDIGQVCIPATSIAGVFNHYLAKFRDTEVWDLFGYKDEDTDVQSKIFIYDSYSSIEGLKISDIFDRRTRVKIDRKTGTSFKKAKIDEKYIQRGLDFVLSFEIYCNKKEKELYETMLYECLKALDQKHIGFGGGGSNGLGRFNVDKVEKIDYILYEKTCLKNYLNNKSDNSIDVTSQVKNIELNDNIVAISIKGEFCTPFLIREPNFSNDIEVDGRNLKSKDQYIIPGSSFKGVFRAKIEKIADFHGKKNTILKLFGDSFDENEDNKRKKKHKKSRLSFSENFIDEKADSVIYNRVKIDKFTGGVISQALINEVPIIGKTEFKIIYEKYNNELLDNFVLGLLSLTIRDLGTGDLSIGGGFSVGRGKFKAESMVLKDGDKEINIDFAEKRITKGSEFLDDYISSLSKYQEELNNDSETN